MRRDPESEVKRLKAALQVAIQGLKDLAQPCTRIDYTPAKLDSVVCDLANRALTQTLSALRR